MKMTVSSFICKINASLCMFDYLPCPPFKIAPFPPVSTPKPGSIGTGIPAEPPTPNPGSTIPWLWSDPTFKKNYQQQGISTLYKSMMVPEQVNVNNHSKYILPDFT